MKWRYFTTYILTLTLILLLTFYYGISYGSGRVGITDSLKVEQFDHMHDTLSICAQQLVIGCTLSHINLYATKKPTIGVVRPTFTDAAYSTRGNDFIAFYKFFALYNNIDVGAVEGQGKPSVNITTNLNLLTSKIPNLPFKGTVESHIKRLLPNSTVVSLTDSNVNDGNIFENDTSSSVNAYDILILGHQEYVTQQEYENLKKFVANGGTLIELDANAFYAQVKYDKNAQTVTLVKGHSWAFNGHSAWRSAIERWAQENTDWMGSNFYWWAGDSLNITFNNNPFNYTHSHEQYITNPNVKIILNYNAQVKCVAGSCADLQPYPKNPVIATYEKDYGKGKVIVIGLYSDNIFDNHRFLSFFDNLLLSNIDKNN